MEDGFVFCQVSSSDGQEIDGVDFLMAVRGWRLRLEAGGSGWSLEAVREAVSVSA
jgi:hypothetical protein